MTEERKWYVTTKGARHSYARVVHTQECSYVPRATNAHIWTRNPLDEPDTSGVYACERCKPQPSQQTVVRQRAKLKADMVNHEAKQQAYQERCNRAFALAGVVRAGLNIAREDGYVRQPQDVVEFEYQGHRYRIEEVDND